MPRIKSTQVQKIIPALLAAMLGSLSLSALAQDDYYDNARVISVTPQTERINTPREECHTEYVRESYSTSRSPLGAIIGGVAGGLLGSNIGRGNGRVAGAAVGAGVGAVVGDHIGNNQSTTYGTRPVESCVTVDNWQTVSRGYLVTYRYNGRTYTTQTDNDPGDIIRIHVAVAPDNSFRGERISALEPVFVAPAYPTEYRDNPGRHRGWGRHHGWHDDDDD
jgi:uncharacterized protein YcfJ